MSAVPASPVANHILRALPPDDYECLRPHLEPFDGALGHVLTTPGEAVHTIYFPLSGVASITRPTQPGQLEVGLIGFDGFVGVPVILHAETSPNQTMVQMPGTFVRMRADVFAEIASARPALQQLLLRFVHVLLVQTESTAIAYSLLHIESRLARWILMFHDRSESDEIRVTHEFLSMMLGVRRPGVTGAIHLLEGNGLIRATRGLIVVRNRPKLEELVGYAYGTAEREHERLIGVPLRRRPVAEAVRSTGAIA